jgi:hypothetical protein
VSGNVTVNISSSDDVGVNKVELYINNSLRFTGSSANCSYTWNTANEVNGQYTLVAKAYDVAGNVGQSSNVFAIVNNATSGAGAISKSGWKLKSVDSQETSGENGAAANAFDGNPSTIWHTQWSAANPACPHEIQIDLGATYNVSSFSYLPRQDGGVNGDIAKYEFYVSTDGTNWGSAVATGTFDSSSAEKKVTCTAKQGRYIRLRALSEINGNPWTSAAELNAYGTLVSSSGTSDTSGNSGTSSTTSSTTSSALSKSGWKLKYADSQETSGENGAAANAFDGNSATIWHTQWSTANPTCPHEIQIDLGANYTMDAFSYLPRQDGGVNGGIAKYEFYVSSDGTNWGTAVATGTFDSSNSEKKVTFTATQGRYVRLRALSEINGNPWTSVAELNMFGK